MPIPILADGLFGRSTTSSTSNSIGGGVKTFTLDTDDGSFKTDYTVQILANGEPDVFMFGIVTAKTTSVSPCKITVAVFRYSDLVGTYDDWTLQVIAGPFAGLPASQTLGVSTDSAAVPAIGDSLSWTTDTGRAFYDNSTVYVSSVVDPTAFFFATVVSYNSGTGAIKFVVNRVGGSGTLALWTISLIDVTQSFRTTVGDVNYAIKPSDKIVVLTADLTADRTWTLPFAASVPKGYQLNLMDGRGTCGRVNGSGFIVDFAAQAGDSLSAVIGLKSLLQSVILTSDGSASWTNDLRDELVFAEDVQFSSDVHILGTLTVDTAIDVSGGSAGQIKFPASQNASADANTLDDYEEGTFTPTVAFATPGTSSFSYATQTGAYTKIGNFVFIRITLTFTPTIGTGTGDLIISGNPFNPATQGYASVGRMNSRFTWSAGYTQISGALNTDGTINLEQIGSAKAAANIGATNMSTGNAHQFTISGSYRV